MKYVILILLISGCGAVDEFSKQTSITFPDPIEELCENIYPLDTPVRELEIQNCIVKCSSLATCELNLESLLEYYENIKGD